MASKSPTPAFEPYEDQPNVPSSHPEPATRPENDDVEVVLKPDSEIEAHSPQQPPPSSHQHPLHSTQRQFSNYENAAPYGQSAMPVTLEEYVTRYNQEVESEDYKASRCCCLVDTYPRMAYYLAMALPMCVFPWMIVFQPDPIPRIRGTNVNRSQAAQQYHDVAFTAVFVCIAVLTVVLTVICGVFVIQRPRLRASAIVGMTTWVVIAVVLHGCAYGLSRCIAYRNADSDTSLINCIPFWIFVGPLFAYPFIVVPLILIFLCVYAANKGSLNSRQLRVAGGPCHQPGEGESCSTYHSRRQPVSSFADIASVNAGRSAMTIGVPMDHLA